VAVRELRQLSRRNGEKCNPGHCVACHCAVGKDSVRSAPGDASEATEGVTYSLATPPWRLWTFEAIPIIRLRLKVICERRRFAVAIRGWNQRVWGASGG